MASGCSPSPALDRGSSCAFFLDSFWTQDVNATVVLGHTRGRRGSGRPGPSSTEGSLRPGSPAHESLLARPSRCCGLGTDSHAALSILGLWEAVRSPHDGRRQAAVGRGTARLRPIHVLETDPWPPTFRRSSQKPGRAGEQPCEAAALGAVCEEGTDSSYPRVLDT